MNHKTDTHPSSPPCTHHPGDWINPRQRALTRRQCLTCPLLADCAASARRNRPSYGMWAGVWIDGDFAAKQHLLALPQPAAGTTADPHHHRRPTPPPPTDRKPRRQSIRRVGPLCTIAPAPAVAALITARASGHCEIMASACTYQQAAIFSRRRSATPAMLSSPADAIAACRNCIELIEYTDLPTALDLGYLVNARRTTSTAAMLWRQQRWVYLDTRGRLHAADRTGLSAIA